MKTVAVPLNGLKAREAHLTLFHKLNSVEGFDSVVFLEGGVGIYWDASSFNEPAALSMIAGLRVKGYSVEEEPVKFVVGDTIYKAVLVYPEPEVIVEPLVPPFRLVGMGVSAGVVIAQARPLEDPAQIAKEFKPGEILVCATTSPDWIEAFFKASAIVTGVGSQLCHAAIVSRELGLPAVVGIKEFGQIRPDQLLSINGETGVVEGLVA